MTRLLSAAPFGPREDSTLLSELSDLTRRHLRGCREYARMWPAWSGADRFEDLPFVHAGVFKHLVLKTEAEDVQHHRTLTSSGTSGSQSRIVLDQRSSELQSESSLSILKDLLGDSLRPLLIHDNVRSLRQRTEVSAAVAAAMSMRRLASDIQFVLEESGRPSSMQWDTVLEAASSSDELLMYGFTWVLWQAWDPETIPPGVKEALRGKRIRFVHSGGWKRLEGEGIDRAQLESRLLTGVGQGSEVVDFYGLVEQVGVIYPLCNEGFRHAPIWAEVIARLPHTLEPSGEEAGMLQLLNPLALGAPYHSVLTEDLGRVIPGDCPCGRIGRRFELLGRIPKAEVRGCGNV